MHRLLRILLRNSVKSEIHGYILNSISRKGQELWENARKFCVFLHRPIFRERSSIIVDEKLEWSRRQPLLDNEPTAVFTRTIVLVPGRCADDYRHDLNLRIMRRFTWKTRGGNRERAGEILAPKSLTLESMCREICRAQSRSARTYEHAIHRRNYIMTHYK